ncbi:hypothetical protein [Yersinia pekkanenii]|uniref:Uncharacterized protein n=2 Tax=Yersinia pekkanenii TaxID=1288385 RepID=A0A0T9R781_9GAMM|nr:hypothetical protein [Yersinia pekkanenii]CNI47612.1 Uncharacterised protein [Yersinia pekkanenii]CRY69137.1 Uncharacterised protein [Yersinia pekkanenii]
MYASFALAESRTKGTLYLPDRNGWTIEYPHKNGGRGSLGTILFELTLSLSGSLGASLAIEAGVNLNGNSIKGVPAKSGEGSEGGPGRRKMDITKAIDDSDIAGELSVFVGIEYGVNLSGALKWRNPEKPKDFAVLAKVGAGVTVQAGAGASGMITFTFKGGTVRTMVKGGLCWGGGGKGVASFEIDVEKIASEFLPCFTYMLRNMDYEKLTKIVLESDYYAFCMLPILLLNGVKFGVEIENITESLISSWESKEQRVTLMDKINDSDGDCLKYSPPETKGAVIAALIETNFWDTLSLSSNQMQPCDGPGAIMSARKLAILYTLKWVQSQRDYENVMQHLDKIPGAKVKGDWEKNQQQVLAFLAKGEEARIYPYVGLVQASHYAEKLAQIYVSLPTANNIDPDIPLQPVNSVLLSSCSKLVYQQHNKNNGAMLA